MEGEFLIGEFQVLFENGAAEHLLWCHLLSASIGTMGYGEVLEHTVHDRGHGIDAISETPLSSLTIKLLMMLDKRYISYRHRGHVEMWESASPCRISYNQFPMP